jgi:hypothetical protein
VIAQQRSMRIKPKWQKASRAALGNARWTKLYLRQDKSKSSSKGDGTAYNRKQEAVLAGESRGVDRLRRGRYKGKGATVTGERFRRVAALSPGREDVL